MVFSVVANYTLPTPELLDGDHATKFVFLEEVRTGDWTTRKREDCQAHGMATTIQQRTTAYDSFSLIIFSQQFSIDEGTFVE